METTYAIGFSYRKRPLVRAFLHSRRIDFISSPSMLPLEKSLSVATWGMRYEDTAFPAGAQITRLEDGFIRSVGLGADLVRPLSWVCDDLGIYYNAQRPSRLERILVESSFDPEILARAKKLRLALIAAGITKYNVGSVPWKRSEVLKKIILVPGQVESDASIKYGAGQIRTNLDLLKAVRGKHPDDYILYKPHPDVVAGLRAKGSDGVAMDQYCDEIIGDVGMADLLDEIDEVHTMTSLTGFEALMRSKKVVTYGMPFYAGWGLTVDVGMIESVSARRGRPLALDELVAGALILYPTYVGYSTEKRSTPEEVLGELRELKKTPPHKRSLKQIFLRWVLSIRKY